MNDFVAWISQQEAFLFKDIPFSILYVLVLYLLIISFFRFLLKRNYSNLKFFLVTVIMLQFAFIYTDYKKLSNAFIVFHKSRYTLVANVENNNMVVAHDFDSITKNKNRIIKDFTLGSHIKTVEESQIQSIYNLDSKKLLVVDSLGIYTIKSFKPEYILLRQSPKINLNRLIDSINPKHVIADGSNYKSYIEYWETTCKKRKLPFHQTIKKGAYIINY